MEIIEGKSKQEDLLSCSGLSVSIIFHSKGSQQAGGTRSLAKVNESFHTWNGKTPCKSKGLEMTRKQLCTKGSGGSDGQQIEYESTVCS